jgi:hypothetical protein
MLFGRCTAPYLRRKGEAPAHHRGGRFNAAWFAPANPAGALRRAEHSGGLIVKSRFGFVASSTEGAPRATARVAPTPATWRAGVGAALVPAREARLDAASLHPLVEATAFRACDGGSSASIASSTEGALRATARVAPTPATWRAGVGAALVPAREAPRRARMLLLPAVAPAARFLLPASRPGGRHAL